DLDHTVPFHRGGPTCPCNLAPLCRGHHLLKQHPDWTLTQIWPGALLWITPTGHWHLTGPAP
ncbi:MAG: HNH endonuclease, partial [Actinomadura sp.]